MIKAVIYWVYIALAWSALLGVPLSFMWMIWGDTTMGLRLFASCCVLASFVCTTSNAMMRWNE